MLLAAAPAKAEIFEYPYIYKSSSAMMMGGAAVAVGTGDASCMLYNPATLSEIKTTSGFEVKVPQIEFVLSKNAVDAYKDVKDALDKDNDTDKLIALNDVVNKYLGKNFHVELSGLILSMAKNMGNYALGGAVLATTHTDFKFHEGFSSSGLVDVKSLSAVGAEVGASRELFDGRLTAGAALKLFTAKTLDKTFTTYDIVKHSDDLSGYLDNETQSGNSMAVDVGLLLKPLPDNYFHPQIGFSITNVGDLNFGGSKIPMSVNVGLALKPEFEGIKGFFKNPVVAVDVVDVTKNNGVDDDIGKRIRVGAKVSLFDNRWASINMGVGLYQGYPTFGAKARFGIISASFLTYGEEVGAYAGQEEDRRYMGSLSVEW